FGYRGIDAATLIGEAMGKTGDQIRSEITAGTLDADEALDALAQSMKSKYKGASDNIRNTFHGAVDNMKAAWRDLGAALAKPLVNPDGGGMLVDLANQAADLMYWLEALPGPVLTVGAS